MNRSHLLRPLIAGILMGGMMLVTNPAFANAKIMATYPVPYDLYFANDGALYHVDFSSFKDDMEDFLDGDGTIAIEVDRLLYTGSPSEKLFEFGSDPALGPHIRLLGSNADEVETIGGLHPDDATSRQTVLTVVLSREQGIATATASTGDDLVEFSVPENYFNDNRFDDSQDGELRVNEEFVTIDNDEYENIRDIALGQIAYSGFLVPGVVELAEELVDHESLKNAMTGFAVAIDDLEGMQPNGAEVFACMGICGSCASLVSDTVGAVGIMVAACGTVVLCLLAIAYFILLMIAAGAACAVCLECIGEGGTGGGEGGCEGVGSGCYAGTACPPAHVSTGECVIAGNTGICCEPSSEAEDCDPVISPSGCECPEFIPEC